VIQVLEQRFPGSLWSRPWRGRLCLFNPWRSTVEQISICSLSKGPHTGAGGYL